MSNFKSRLAPLIDKFVTYRDAIGQWNSTYAFILRSFDRYCLEHSPEAELVTQELVDGWSMKRETESENSLHIRLLPLCAFLRYLSERNIPSAQPPELPRYVKTIPAPHPLTEEELRRFFAVCDSEDCCRRGLSPKLKAIRRLTVPVFMRFQYSTGMRPGATLYLPDFRT